MSDKLKLFFKKMASRKSFWITLGAFTLALFLIALIYMYQPKFVPEPIRTGLKKVVDEVILGERDANKIGQETNNQSAVNNNQGSNNPANNEQTANIDTSTWQTYTNQEYGFSVKYPEGLKPQPIKDTSRIAFTNTPIREDTDQMAPIELVVTNKTIEQEIDEIKKISLENYQEKEIMVDGAKGKKITGKFGLFYWGEVNFSYVIYERNSKTYEWSAYTEDKNIAEKFEFIISSIKFDK